MVIGMTGFGAAEFNHARIKCLVEIKTVNHRYLDVVYYLPSGFSAFEERIGKLISKSLKRGRVTVSVRIVDKPQTNISFNEEAIVRYRDFARQLAKKYGMNNDLTAADLLKLPGVIEAKEVFVEAQVLWPAAERALGQALHSVVDMRKREGKSLLKDILGQLTRMNARIGLIRKRVHAINKLKKSELTNDEFLAFQKSNDVNEELARLTHHINEAKSLIKSGPEAGKKLDFIAQEMQRETNTIGSKVQDNEISAAVIAIKGKIEKIREQANNVE